MIATLLSAEVQQELLSAVQVGVRWITKTPVLCPTLCLVHLHDVQLWQQVAVCQSQLVPVQKAPLGELGVLHAVRVDLVGQGVVQVVVQLIQGSGQTFLQA